MTDWLLALVPLYGLWLVAFATFMSCLALPFPASIIMLAAGGFAAAGDLVLWQAVAAALAGAVVGDQAGYAAGRLGGAGLVDRLSRTPARRRLIAQAGSMMARRGALAVFLTRWLFSPLGPYVNLIYGAMRQNWPRFTLWAIAGEAVWSGLYVTIGSLMAGNLEAAAELLSSVLGLFAAGTATLGLGWWLLVLAHNKGKSPL